MQDRLQYKNSFIEGINHFVNANFPDNLQLFFQLFIKVGLLILLTLFIDTLFKRLLLPTIKRVLYRFNNAWLKELYKEKVFHALIHFLSLIIAYQIQPYFLNDHPLFFDYTGKIYFIACLILFLVLIFRVLKAWQDYSIDDSQYISVAIKSFIQIFKIFSILISVFVIVFVFFDISVKDILTVIGAITAVILLVFRDPILGFVAGLQVSTTKMLKVGDWIEVPKYNIEGNLSEINLITSKIINFDKTISSIPTYDLITTEVKSFESLRDKKVRNIKRSLLCNVKSFHFLTLEDIEKYQQIPILKKYLEKKLVEIEEHYTQTPSHLNYKRQLTNIGVFRKYIELFLKQNPKIDKNNPLVVRQLEMTANGLPLEIYCFTSQIEWVKFEETASDIFDHIITIAKEFDIKIVQTVTL